MPHFDPSVRGAGGTMVRWNSIFSVSTVLRSSRRKRAFQVSKELVAMETSIDLASSPRVAEPPSRQSALTASPTTAVPLTTAPKAARPSVAEFLAFKLGGEEYGIDILRVQEIRSFEQPTRIANAPRHILGVVNLRGIIVPIVDLRVKFAIDPLRYDASTVVIVLNIGTRVFGIVVDAVSDVITLAPEELHDVPPFGSAICSEHLLAIGTVESRMLILVDIEKLMTSADMGLVALALQ